MSIITRTGTKSRFSRLLTYSVLSSASIYGTPPQTCTRRNVTNFNFDFEQLGEPHARQYKRPVFKRQAKMSSNVTRATVIDRKISRGTDEEQSLTAWQYECERRLVSAGCLARSSVRTPVNLWDDCPVVHPFWYTAKYQYMTCERAFVDYSRPSSEIGARKLCAKLKDDRYPEIFWSLSPQAHILYLLGRVELERAPSQRALAYYILLISAGLGQLDAALLLHQLEKGDARYSVQSEQRAVLADAADRQLDWRAMLAQCEYMAYKSRGRGSEIDLRGAELEQCLDLLEKAIHLAIPDISRKVDREKPPDGYIDAEALEVYDPPYKLLLQITAAQLNSGNHSERIVELFEHAAKIGAHKYKDPDAAWELALWYLSHSSGNTKEWEDLATFAAESANVDACFELAKYQLNRDGWWPSLAFVILEQQRNGVIKRDNLSENNYTPALQNETTIQEDLMSRKNDSLLNAYEGLSWMKTAAQLHIDNPIDMYNRYCIIAGLLRQNGFFNEGKEVVREALTQLNMCVGNETAKSRALQNMAEFLDAWDQEAVQVVLPPHEIEKLLGPPQRRESSQSAEASPTTYHS